MTKYDCFCAFLYLITTLIDNSLSFGIMVRLPQAGWRPPQPYRDARDAELVRLGGGPFTTELTYEDTYTY